MSYQVKVEILGGRSYTKRQGKEAGQVGFIHDCLIRDDDVTVMDVHFSDSEVKPGEYMATIKLGQTKDRKRTYYINDLRPLTKATTVPARAAN